MENFIKSSIDLFNTVPVDEIMVTDKKSCNSKELIEHGYYIDSSCIIDITGEMRPILISDRVKNILIEKSFQINKAFYTKWNDILLKDRNQLLIDQLFHYATVWVKDVTKEKESIIYIPNCEWASHKGPRWTIPLRILKQETKAEIKNKAKLMLYSNIALKEETILNIFNIISFDEIELNNIKNRDSKILIQTKLRIIPKTAEDLMKCLIYSITGNLEFVKNKELNDMIRAKATSENTLFWIKNNEILLSQIFNRYKSIFLNMKKNADLKSHINKISHLSKKHHEPKKVLKPDLSNGFQMTRYLKYLIKEKQPRSFIIRNGKIWCERNKFEEILLYKEKIKKILNSYSLKQSPFTKITLPVSEKNFIGNYPMGSEFTHKNLIVGIYWKNNQSRVDLDLSSIDIVQKIGWDSHYYDSRNKNNTIFSGDITDAPNGANEYLRFGTIDTPKLVQVNYYNFNSNKNEVEFDIIVGFTSPQAAPEESNNNFNDKVLIEKSTMLRPENVIVSMKTSINCSKTKTLGVVYPGGRFVVIDKYIGKAVQTNGVGKTDMQILIDSFTSNNLFFEEFITPTNAETQNVLDLRTEHISKDKLLSIFGGSKIKP